ncbi:MAG: DMT family transporter [Methylocapsa sp.]|nr:DMT family transporter [Methylocapsa sp.]
MSPVLFTPFIIAAGALHAFGAVMSARLRMSLANPWLSLAVLFSLNAFLFAALFAMFPRPLPGIEGSKPCPGGRRSRGSRARLRSSPGLALIDKMGAGFVNGLIIAANLITSLIIDQFG